MQLKFLPHADKRPSGPMFDMWADIEHRHMLGRIGSIHIWFCVGAPIDRFVVPPPTEQSRADDLWQSTCFEAFLKPADGDAYREWNFSPSSQWAAYDFESYRSKRENADVESPPYIRNQDNLRWWQLGATIPVEADQRWQLGLSAVLEEKDGTKSYWALAHGDGPPDFHSPDCFAAQLP